MRFSAVFFVLLVVFLAVAVRFAWVVERLALAALLSVAVFFGEAFAFVLFVLLLVVDCDFAISVVYQLPTPR